MKTAEFVASLAARGTYLFLADGRLSYRANEVVDERVLSEIDERRSELIDHLETSWLSSGQEALWFLYELDRKSAAYNTVFAAHLTPELDPEALSRALADLHERHSALRSRFGTAEGKPLRRVTQNNAAPIAVVDAETWTESEIDTYLAASADEPFDLESGPVVRWRLITNSLYGGRRGPILLFAGHHIVVDFRSIEILLRDLTQIYQAHTDRGAPVLPALRASWRTQAEYTRAWVTSAGGEKSRRWWKQQLDGELPVLDLPTDHVRPAHQQSAGGTFVASIAAGCADRLKAFAREQGVTPNVVLLSAFSMLLSRYSRQDEILVGSPMLGRPLDEWQNLVGYFVNPVVLRLRPRGSKEGREYLREVRTAVLDALAHQEYPFPLIVEELNPRRDPSRSPLFQVAFVYERWAAEPAGGLFDEQIMGGQRGAVFDITFTAMERPDGFRLTWEYASALFSAETIERMNDHLRRLLESLMAAPGLPIGQLPLLIDGEEERLALWNDTSVPRLGDETVIDLIEQQAARNPHAIAVESGEKRWSYGELDRRAGHLAARLQRMGVGPNSPVAIAMPRGVELIAAVTGVMKAGGVCLPLDVDHPAERIRFIVRESGVRWVLTDAQTAPGLPDLDATIVFVETGLEGDESFEPVRRAGPEDLIYILYTSGSTGQPKGVAMPHRAITNLVHWQSAEAARVLQFTPLTFDVSFQEIATTLCSGGTLVMIDDVSRRDSSILRQFIEDGQIERLFLPFVALHYLANLCEETGLPATLRDVITAGEQLRITPAIQACFERSRARLHNHYGPTETHVITAHTLPIDAATWESLPPIGSQLIT